MAFAGCPTLTVTYTVKPNEPHGYPTITVTTTVKLTEPQGCLTLTAIVAVKLQLCPETKNKKTKGGVATSFGSSHKLASLLEVGSLR